MQTTRTTTHKRDRIGTDFELMSHQQLKILDFVEKSFEKRINSILEIDTESLFPKKEEIGMLPSTPEEVRKCLLNVFDSYMQRKKDGELRMSKYEEEVLRTKKSVEESLLSTYRTIAQEIYETIVEKNFVRIYIHPEDIFSIISDIVGRNIKEEVNQDQFQSPKSDERTKKIEECCFTCGFGTMMMKLSQKNPKRNMWDQSMNNVLDLDEMTCCLPDKIRGHTYTCCLYRCQINPNDESEKYYDWCGHAMIASPHGVFTAAHCIPLDEERKDWETKFLAAFMARGDPRDTSIPKSCVTLEIEKFYFCDAKGEVKPVCFDPEGEVVTKIDLVFAEFKEQHRSRFEAFNDSIAQFITIPIISPEDLQNVSYHAFFGVVCPTPNTPKLYRPKFCEDDDDFKSFYYLCQLFPIFIAQLLCSKRCRPCHTNLEAVRFLRALGDIDKTILSEFLGDLGGLEGTVESSMGERLAIAIVRFYRAVCSGPLHLMDIDEYFRNFLLKWFNERAEEYFDYWRISWNFGYTDTFFNPKRVEECPKKTKMLDYEQYIKEVYETSGTRKLGEEEEEEEEKKDIEEIEKIVKKKYDEIKWRKKKFFLYCGLCEEFEHHVKSTQLVVFAGSSGGNVYPVFSKCEGEKCLNSSLGIISGNSIVPWTNEYALRLYREVMRDNHLELYLERKGFSKKLELYRKIFQVNCSSIGSETSSMRLVACDNFSFSSDSGQAKCVEEKTDFQKLHYFDSSDL